MNRRMIPILWKHPGLFVALVAATGLIAGVALAQGTLKLIVNGHVISTNVRVIGGSAYVKLSDVARALDMTVVPRAGGYEMVPAGGADQLQGKGNGTMGDTIFTGEFRFIVTLFETVDNGYTQQYSQDKQFISPKRPGDTMFIVDCRIKNGTKAKQEIVLSPSGWGENTSLTDEQEHSYAPINIDGHYDEGGPGGAWILPGAAYDFAVVFSVPKGTKPKDFVYTIVKYGERGSNKGTDVRVSLTS